MFLTVKFIYKFSTRYDYISMDSSDDNNDIEISAEMVASYLEEHPTFFKNRDDLLLEMRLPHASGNAISLMERQVNVLRERNMEMRHRLNRLLDTARDNDKLFDKTKRLVLSLLEVNTPGELAEAVHHSLNNDFQVDFSQLTLFGDPQQFNSNVRVLPIQSANREIGSVLKNSKAVCGALRPEELKFLFPDDYAQVGSAAVVPLSFNYPLGVLAIGSEDPHYFRSSMGTLFLSYIAEVLNRTLPRILPRPAM